MQQLPRPATNQDWSSGSASDSRGRLVRPCLPSTPPQEGHPKNRLEIVASDAGFPNVRNNSCVAFPTQGANLNQMPHE